jgi:ferredoxin-NADP reductase
MKSTKQLQQFYRQIFESPAGQAVIEDLERVVNQTRVSSDSPNPYSAVYIIGQQQLIRRIRNMMKEQSAVQNNKEHII